MILLPPLTTLLKKHSMQFWIAHALVFHGCCNTSRCRQIHTWLPSVYPPVTGLSKPLLLLTVFCGSVFLILNKTKSWQPLTDCVCTVGDWSCFCAQALTPELLCSHSSRETRTRADTTLRCRARSSVVSVGHWQHAVAQCCLTFCARTLIVSSTYFLPSPNNVCVR